MTYDQLDYFVSSYEFRSFTKAAKKHFVSQPAISNAIKLLEEEFETELFSRNNNQLTPTQAGDYLYTYAKSVISLFSNISPQMKDYISSTTQIRIGIPPMLGGFIFAPVFDKFLKKYPGTNVKLSELASSANQKAVVDGEIDLALTVINQQEIDPSLNHQKIGEAPLVFAVRKNHPMAGREYVSFGDLENIPLLLMKEDSLQYKVVMSEFEKAKITPNIRLLTNQIATIKELLAYGDDGAFLFSQVIKENDELVGIPLEGNLSFDIVLATKKNQQISKQTKRFYDFIVANYS